jgi:hypothetical protein
MQLAYLQVREGVAELAYLAAGHAVFARLLSGLFPSGAARPLATGLAMSALTNNRWSEPNRRLVALALLVRTLGLFQNLEPSRARMAIAAAFALVTGELGRRYRGWPGPQPTLHPQFVTVMSRLSGMRDPRAFALDPVAVGRRYHTVAAWTDACVRSALFALPLMATAYGLQEVVHLLVNAAKGRPKRVLSTLAAEDANGGGAAALDVVPPRQPSRLELYLTKVARTSGIYVYLGMYTVALMSVTAPLC